MSANILQRSSAHMAVCMAVIWSLASTVAADPPKAPPKDPFADVAEDINAEMDDVALLRFVDAVTGKPVPGATVTFDGRSAVTDANGSVRFPKPDETGGDERIVPATFEKKGYVKATIPVRFVVGSLFSNRFSVSPTLPPDKLRIVLEWGDAPRDLDAHAVKEGTWHISFHDMRKYQDRAWLDRDCMSGEGPETITVARLDEAATYRYYVHDYTNRGKRESSGLGASRATVRIYGDDGLLRTFYVPPAIKGDRWEVFRVERGDIIPPGGQ